MSDFGKFWNDLKKHRKRRDHWLPHWKEIAAEIDGDRPVRYLTLCARSMIDIFMLLKEGLLHQDPDSHAIGFVRFCECEAEDFAEINDIIATEDAGFFVRLEDAILFEDNVFSEDFTTISDIDAKLEDQRIEGDTEKVDKLQQKRTHLHVRDSFPYDCVNLDFCEYYYPQPPGMLRINQALERIFDWQENTSQDGSEVKIEQFALAVTCRHDGAFPIEAESRLIELIGENKATLETYAKAILDSRGDIETSSWAKNNQEDFFFSAWPKDIARSARQRGWAMEIVDYVYYRRVGDQENPYIIACLVAKFSRNDVDNKYVSTALHALGQNNRTVIEEIGRTSAEGTDLLEDLTSIVALRNEQAKRVSRAALPAP